MRRSAAPSFRADIKRARFLPQIMKTVSFINNTEDVPKNPKEINSLTNTALTVIEAENENKKSPETIRSNKDVLDIIFEADSTISETVNSCESISSSKENYNLHSTEKNILPLLSMESSKKNKSVISSHSISNEDFNEKISNCIFCVKEVEEASLFNVVWCKRSGKKHKTWEGDGFLIVRNRSAVLKDLDGKTLDKGVGYKLKETESLEEGSKFFIGGKECEIQYKIPDEECQSDKYCKCKSSANKNCCSPVKQPEKPVVPVSTSKAC